jgi:PAS domain S-box-containing protein
MPESYRNLALFRIFVARATAEQLRLRAEVEIRAREERLKGVFNGTMDVIVEMDIDLNIMMMNPAGEGVFGCNPSQCIGKSFKQFLTSENVDRLYKIINNLKHRPKGEQRDWIPEGLLVLNTDRKKIQTDATISQVEIDDNPCYVLVLRDVDERHTAEKTIASLQDETFYLRDEVQAIYDHGNVIGQSKPFRKVLELVSEVAPTDSTVLLYGETGTGKELIARAIHAASRRKDRSLITVNCAAIPDTLMESEFFGHEKGAFTGATQRRQGRFSLADGGTIFLDELGEMSLGMQSKLLRVLQEGEFSPVGSSHNQRVDVRVIAATNRNLSHAVQQRTFRTDLYYRLSVFPITIPPLRERGNDIVLLADHFIEKYASRMKKHVETVSIDLGTRLRKYNWPGNVRELQNVIERGVITARYGRLNVEFTLPQTTDPGVMLESAIETVPADRILTVAEVQQFERDNLILALQHSQWRVAGKKGAAQLLGMPTSTLQSRIKSFGIKRPS